MNDWKKGCSVNITNPVFVLKVLVLEIELTFICCIQGIVLS
jgi:hypothetical protein